MSHRPGFLVYFLFELEIELSRLIEINKSLQNENERLERDLGIEKEQIKVFQKIFMVASDPRTASSGPVWS